MRISKNLKRALAWVVALALVIGIMPNPIPIVTAEDLGASATVTDADENYDSDNNESDTDKQASYSLGDDEKNSESNNSESQDSVSQDESKNSKASKITDTASNGDADKADEESEKEAEEAEESDVAFYEEKTVEGVIVKVEADEGVFPAGSTLSVRKVTDVEAANTGVVSAVNKERIGDKTVAAAKTYDITVFDAAGNEIQPDNSKGNVRVSFTDSLVANTNLDTDVYHINTSNGIVDADKLNDIESGKTVTAETDGFSYYVVEFTYGTKEVEMKLGDKISFTEIANSVGLEGTATDVTTTSSCSGIRLLIENGETYLEVTDSFTETPIYGVQMNNDTSVSYVISVKFIEELHVHDDGTEFHMWTKTDSMPSDAGNYYLTDDVTLASAWHVPSGEVNICLNGKTITNQDRCFYVNSGTTLSIYDEGNGKIVNARTSDGKDGAIYIYPGATVNLYGGSIESNKYGVVARGTFNMSGGAISGNAFDFGSTSIYAGGVTVSGTFNMTGGTISGNRSENSSGGVSVEGGTYNLSGGNITGNSGPKGGIYVKSGTFNLSGNPTISGNTLGSDAVDICLKSGEKISTSNFTGKVGVRIIDKDGNAETGVITNGLNAGDDYDVTSHFISNYKDYLVSKTSDGEAQLEIHEHDGITFTPWTDELAESQNGSGKDASNSLPSVAGDYVLIKDVDASGYYANKDINLCLNGHTISLTGGGSALKASDGANVDIYDDTGNGIIQSTDAADGVIYIMDSSTFNLHAGTITGGCYGVRASTGNFNMTGGTITGNNATNGASAHVAAVEVEYGSSASITGGSITGNSFKYGGVYVAKNAASYGDNTLYLSGSPSITGNSSGTITSDITLDDGVKINTGALSNTTPYNVTIIKSSQPAAGTFTTNYSTNNPNTDADAYFTSGNAGLYVAKTADGTELRLAPHTHEWTYTTDTTSANVINANCTGTVGTCDITGQPFKLTVTAQDKDYNGNLANVLVSKDTGWTQNNLLDSNPGEYKLQGADDSTYSSSFDAINAGKYTVRVGVGDDTTGITYATADFEIRKIALEVTPEDVEINYGETPADPDVTYDGFIQGEDESVLGGTLQFEYVDDEGNPYQPGSPAGEYKIKASGLTADNYEITYVDAKLTVNKLPNGKSFEVRLGDGIEGFEVTDDSAEVADMLLNEVDEQKVAEGAEALTYMTVEKAEPDADVIAAIKAAADELAQDNTQENTQVNTVIDAFYDINVYKDITLVGPVQLHELDAPIAFNIGLSENAQSIPANATRTYGIVRYHDSTAELIDSDLVSGTLESESDKYSLFAVVYTDIIQQIPDDTKKEDTNTDSKSDTTPSSQTPDQTPNQVTPSGDTAPAANVTPPAPTDNPVKKAAQAIKAANTGDNAPTALTFIVLILDILLLIVVLRIKKIRFGNNKEEE